MLPATVPKLREMPICHNTQVLLRSRLQYTSESHVPQRTYNCFKQPAGKVLELVEHALEKP